MIIPNEPIYCCICNKEVDKKPFYIPSDYWTCRCIRTYYCGECYKENKKLLQCPICGCQEAYT